MSNLNFDNSAALVLMNNSRNQETLNMFGDKLITLRITMGLTPEQLAFEADIELSQVHRVGKWKINPTITTLMTLEK